MSVVLGGHRLPLQFELKHCRRGRMVPHGSRRGLPAPATPWRTSRAAVVQIQICATGAAMAAAQPLRAENRAAALWWIRRCVRFHQMKNREDLADERSPFNIQL